MPRMASSNPLAIEARAVQAAAILDDVSIRSHRNDAMAQRYELVGNVQVCSFIAADDKVFRGERGTRLRIEYRKSPASCGFILRCTVP